MLKISRAPRRALIFALLFICEAAAGAVVMATTAPPPPPRANRAGRALGTIVGSVCDRGGKPLAGALVVVLREGAEEIIKEARTGIDGQFSARVAAGRYSLRAVAAGFNPAGFASVQLTPSSELVYRFNLEPTGDGRTAPERRSDRDETKWRLRAAQSRRSIFQVSEGRDETVAAVQAAGEADEDGPTYAAQEPITDDDAHERAARPQGVIETYAAASANSFVGNYAGTNFAVAQQINDELNLILAGQIAYGGAAVQAPQRFEATARLRVNDEHRLSISGGGMRLGGMTATVRGGTASEQLAPTLPAASGANFGDDLGQISFGAYDEWSVRDGVIVVLGVDYARFTGANGGGADALRPRVGLQYDLDASTRLRAAYAPGAEGGATAQGTVQFEDGAVIFNEAHLRPVATSAQTNRPVMENSRRLEIGLERVLDSRSSVEATAFLDTFDGRGVGLMGLPLTAFAAGTAAGDEFLQIAQQQGAARGVRLLYSRRFGSSVKASIGYSFGRGQALSPAGISDPAKLWQNGFFQTAAAQIETALPTKTRVRTVFRFSPGATVFAIDPFAGRLAVFDPSLSFFLTQELPAFGLPVRVEAVLDARNLLDTPAGAAEDGETLLLVGTARRSVRGGISLRF